jgi:hypothetical protein
MENVLFKINDKKENNIFFDVNLLAKQIEVDYFELNNKEKIKSLEEEYNNLFTLNQIKIISGFYNINYKKQSKDDIIKKIVLFEINEQNKELVEVRKRLINNLLELKNNIFFSKYIMFNW